ncbi:PIN domain-containing protein [Coleofasciculus sp. FACHB-T130]|uniref:PIN domain-containing protein n=1 Tax=Cyanophyceae TaxID=3028117 RepID=UPI0016853CF2|nr:PIN domain-containing protein [Coleofasciculus sp. FACHB-T130]MBD1878197.1 DUF4935 domain-containing protein [Coleofasciculus sp. FACHB-T130]
MKTPVTILDAAQYIAVSPAPVVLIDTCTVLDVIRAPQRESTHIISAASNMTSRASVNPKQLWVVATELIDNEWKDNCQKVEDELTVHIKKIDSQHSNLRIAATYFHPVNLVKPLTLGGLKLPMHLRRVAQSLLDSAVLIADDGNYIIRARNRVRRGEPPAQKGKQEYKDCEIIEHYLAFCKELRDKGFREKCVFTSSNTQDYCDSKKKLHLSLQTDFDALGLEYARDIAHAYSLVK